MRPNHLPLSVSYFSSINKETELCIRTIEKTNRCQRLTHKMIADNSERKLAICQKIVDGKWSDWINIFGAPPTVYEGDVVTLYCQAGPCNPGNSLIIVLVTLYQYSTINLEIKRLKWESEKVEVQENPTEFVTLGSSRILTKASITFTVCS